VCCCVGGRSAPHSTKPSKRQKSGTTPHRTPGHYSAVHQLSKSAVVGRETRRSRDFSVAGYATVRAARSDQLSPRDLALTFPHHTSKFPASQFCSFPIASGSRSPRQHWRGGKRVRIPRCRATVSEKMAASHWEIPGKAGCECRTVHAVLTR